MMARVGVFGFLACALIACGGPGDEDDASSEGALQGHTLTAAREVVKKFYGRTGPDINAEHPELTAEASRKIKDYRDHQPATECYGVRGAFTGIPCNDADSVVVDEPNYVFGMNEASMTVHAKTLGHDYEDGSIDREEVLVTVRVRLSDLKISDISLGTECGDSFQLVGRYDMRSAYPSAEGGAGRVEVYWSDMTKENCVIARCLERCGEKMTRSVKVRADGDWVTDKGEFELFAGPVKVRAPGTCIDVAASFGPEGVAGETKLENKHCN
jgi:hypothetical protein